MKEHIVYRIGIPQTITTDQGTMFTSGEFDKKVKAKEFADGDLVWKLILPIGTKSSKFGKWSPNWEGPYRINQSAPGNAYILETLEGVEFPRALNGKYLKKYYPSIWIDA